jgi:hypothetical protein
VTLTQKGSVANDHEASGKQVSSGVFFAKVVSSRSDSYSDEEASTIEAT